MEGLPLSIAVVLANNTERLLKANVLVRKPSAIETAGSISMLFSDKTGTITQGVLSVTNYITGASDLLDVKNTDSKIKEYLYLAIGKNTSATFGAGNAIVGGNMTDKALLEFMGAEEFKKLENDASYEVLNKQNFNSANKFSSVEIKHDGVVRTFYKGAPEKLLAKATKYIDEDGQVKELNKTAIEARIDEFANRAMRMLGFAYSESSWKENELNDDLVFIGMCSIRDDIRQEAVEAIKECQSAGVAVCQITGDNFLTGRQIAKEAGLIQTDEDVALTSEELNKMSDEEVIKVLPKLRCVTRALPTDKSRLVRLAQNALGAVTGMTGKYIAQLYGDI